MPRTDVEARRSYGKAHYLANKSRYNPKRREVAYLREQANILRWDCEREAEKIIIDLSFLRWVSPRLIKKICSKIEKEKMCASIESGVIKRLSQRWKIGIGSNDGVELIGLIDGHVPFHKGSLQAEEFIKRMPKIDKDDLRAELLILKIALEKQQITFNQYGVYKL